METQGGVQLLLLLYVVSTCWGQQVYLTLGAGPNITTNNTEILMTDIGEDALGGLPSLACHTDLTACCRSVAENNGNGGLGQWTYPDGSELVGNGASLSAGQQFFMVRNGPQLIRLSRRDGNNPLSPTGSYCCTIPTSGGNMTLCAYLVVCLTLTTPTNGVISYYSDPALVNATVAAYSCNAGYILIGGSTRTCENNGIWSGSTPVCQPVSGTCFDLLPLMNGGIIYETGIADSRPINTIAHFTCDNGYTLIGGIFRVCQNDGTWSGSVQTCQLICADLTLTNGMVVYSDTTTPRDVGSTATYTCTTAGFELTGTSMRTCTVIGWNSSDPICTATTTINCSDLTAPTNGMIGYNMGTASPRPEGTLATYNCNPGYTLNGGSTRTCGSDRVWSGSISVCQPICFDLLSLPNGAISYSMGSTDIRPINTIATHSCNDGYTLNGDTTRTCGSDGVWNGSVPTCQLICEDLLPLTNGVISYSVGSTDIRPLNTIATHICNDGYTLNGDSVRVCQNDRTWSGPTPTCQVSCGPPPSIDNGSPGQPTNTMIGGEVTYTCETGFIFIGFEMITCLSTGNWSSSPSCQTPPPVYLSLSSTNYLSGLSEIFLSSVGEGRGLVCHTDLASCCEENTGDWYDPNGSVVMENGALYVSRGQMSVSLMMSGSATAIATAPGGLYCCVVPTSGGIDTACIVLASSTDESSPSDNTGAVVGGVVVALVVVVVTGVVIVTYLVLRYRRGGKMTVPHGIPLAYLGQSTTNTFENSTAIYEEIPEGIPVSSKVEGDYSLTHNNSYLTVGGRGNTEAPAEGIYDN